jgi:hypothetical protein
MIYDVIIFASRDKLKNVKFLYESLVHLQPAYSNVYCVCPVLPAVPVEGIEYVLDKNVLDISKPVIRTDWIYQQYMKLLQNITLDNYLVIDADIVLNKDIVIVDDVPNFLIGRTDINRPFFR